MTPPLPSFEGLLNNCPHAGEGVHGWLYKVARQLHARYPAGEIVQLLRSKTAGCGRVVSDREIIAAVQNSLAVAWQPKGYQKRGPVIAKQASKWPAQDSVRRGNIVRAGGELADLWDASLFKFEDRTEPTEYIIDRLFPANPLLCCGETASNFATKPRDAWRGQMAGLALIVPSPMTAPTGLTKENKVSAHALSNTGSRRFIVCEFDPGLVDDHASLLLHLAGFAPLACAVHSGGKSLHGWFFVSGQAEEKVAKFFKYAVSIGADPRLWSRCQFARMPGGTRDNGNRQRIFFFNPEVIKA